MAAQDRRDIQQNRWLSDDVIDGAQGLVREAMPGQFSGLYACGAVMFLEPLAAPVPGRFIQVVNRATAMSLASMADYNGMGGSHWLVISNVFSNKANQMVVYDSMYTSISNSNRALLEILYTNYPDYEFRFAKVQRQRDSTSCGRWASAFLFDLALGYDPAATRYNETKMAGHLLRCLDQGLVEIFPGTHGCQKDPPNHADKKGNTNCADKKGPANCANKQGPSNGADIKGPSNCADKKDPSNRVSNNSYKTK